MPTVYRYAEFFLECHANPFLCPAREGSLEASQKSFLLEAGKLLASSLEYERTLASVAELIVPELADWCSVNILKEDGSIPPLAIAHVDPARVAEGWTLQKLYPPDLRRRSGIAQVITTRQPLLVPRVDDEFLRRMAFDADHFPLLKALGLSSILVVPLIARDRALGTISLIASDSRIQYQEADVSFAMELAQRAAIAIDNARLHEEAQAAIREKDRAITMLNEVLQQLPCGVVVSDDSGKVVLRNRVASEFWRSSRELPDGPTATRISRAPFILMARPSKKRIGRSCALSRPVSQCYSMIWNC